MATQKGRNWSSGDIVTAANLSSIERGVSAVAEEYTPTTWANGDTVTAAGLNNIEQGIVNAEDGGSSDFSTAQVTISTNEETADGLFIVFVESDNLYISNGVEPGIYTVPLYKGVLSTFYYGTNYNRVSVTGDITMDYMYGDIVITGDGTITIS